VTIATVSLVQLFVVKFFPSAYSGTSSPDVSIFRVFFSMDMIYFIGITFLLSLLVNTFSFIARAINPSVLLHMLFNLYKRAKKVDCLLMYIDLNDSTPISERLPASLYTAFIQDVFKDMAIPVRESSSFVQGIQGDEILLVWPTSLKVRPSDYLDTLFNLEQEVAAKASYYREKYGVVPAFKAGLHYGSLEYALLGVNKVMPTYFGAPLNEGARVIGECHNLGEKLLVSGDAYEKIGQIDGFEFTDRGHYNLKGVNHPMQLWGVSKDQPCQ